MQHQRLLLLLLMYTDTKILMDSRKLYKKWIYSVQDPAKQFCGLEERRTRRWRLDGEQQDSPSEKSYIRVEEFLPFLPASFVIL